MSTHNFFDNSMVSQFQTCPFKYYLRYEKGLVPASASMLDIDKRFGSLTHDFLEAYYKKQTIDLTALWNTFENSEEEKAKTRESGIELCKQYHIRWAEADKNFKVVDTEKRIECIIAGHKFICKPDAVIEYNGEIYVLEHKTTGSKGRDYFKKFATSSQVDAEMYCVKENYGQCSGVFINCLESKVLKTKPTAKANHFYSEEIKDLTHGKLYRIINFDRKLFERTYQQLDDFVYQFSNWILKIKEARQNGTFLKSRGSSVCASFRGCEFQTLCMQSEKMDIEEGIAEEYYTCLDNKFEYLEFTEEEKKAYGIN